jgi:hypothetical protein
MKLPSWIVSFQEEERDKKEMLLFFILILCCQFDQQRCKDTCNYYDIAFYIRESELDSLRLGREFGSVKLYGDNIGSGRSISLFLSAFLSAPSVCLIFTFHFRPKDKLT